MGTEFKTENGEVVATRFFGGKDRGCGAQMAVTEFEFEAFKSEAVFGDNGEDFETFQDFVDSVSFVVWDSAERQNEFARQMENHRFAEARAFAPQARKRARECARQQMSVVN